MPQIAPIIRHFWQTALLTLNPVFLKSYTSSSGLSSVDNLLLDDDVVGLQKKARWMQMMVVGTAKLFETRIIVFKAFCVPLSHQLCWLPCKQGKCYEVQSIFTILVCCVSSAHMSRRPPVCQGVNISVTTLPSLDIYNFTRENKNEWEYVSTCHNFCLRNKVYSEN